MSCCCEPPRTAADASIPFVVPAQAGIHFDSAALPGRDKIKMDPSLRWDDERLFEVLKARFPSARQPVRC